MKNVKGRKVGNCGWEESMYGGVCWQMEWTRIFNGQPDYSDTGVCMDSKETRFYF